MSVDTRVAEQFGQSICNGDFVTAHSLLTESAKASYSPESLKQAVEEMIATGDGPITDMALVGECILDDWRGKQKGDIGYVYVALSGDGFNEAVTITLTNEDGRVRIRSLDAFIVDTGATVPILTIAAVRACGFHAFWPPALERTNYSWGGMIQMMKATNIMAEFAPGFRVHWPEALVSGEEGFFGIVDYRTLKEAHAIIDTGSKTITVRR